MKEKKEMRQVVRDFTIAAVGLLMVLALVAGSSAQEGFNASSEKPIRIQANALGQGTQLGRTFSANIIIQEFSTGEDQKALIEAFTAKKNEGLVNALSKMTSKGRMAISGTLGYDVSYIRKFPQADGTTKIRMVTDRPINFGEAWSDSRSKDYSLSAVEIILDASGQNGSGTLLPACQFKIDKEGQLQIDLLQNAWKLTNVDIR
jgi:hypothetical protein